MVAAGVGWAVDRARAGDGPTLVEVVSYRRSGHAHHDDDRFHGNEAAKVSGYEYAEERAAWERQDPIESYVASLREQGVLVAGTLETMEKEIAAQVAQAAEQAPAAEWPRPEDYRGRVYAPRSLRIITSCRFFNAFQCAMGSSLSAKVAL